MLIFGFLFVCLNVRCHYLQTGGLNYDFFNDICRFGKPLVLDMMEVDMFHTVSDRFDEIEKGLMDKIMDKSIMQEEK